MLKLSGRFDSTNVIVGKMKRSNYKTLLIAFVLILFPMCRDTTLADVLPPGYCRGIIPECNDNKTKEGTECFRSGCYDEYYCGENDDSCNRECADCCLQEDSDGDCNPDKGDNCPDTPNINQSDRDADEIGDVCDNCTNDSNNDADEDGDKIVEKRVIIIKKDGEKVEISEDEVTKAAPLAPATELPERRLEPAAFDAFPNPTGGQLTVRFQAEPGPTVFTITDVLGREIHRQELDDFDGRYDQQIDVRSAAKGTLLLTIRQGERVFTEKVLLK